MRKKIIRYSEAFKRHVVSALESGDVATFAEARQKFGVPGGATVQRWVRRFGRNDLVPKLVRVETPNDKNRLAELRRENERLKRALADAHMEGLLYRSWFEIACREFGVEDMEAFKKKLEGRRSK